MYFFAAERVFRIVLKVGDELVALTEGCGRRRVLEPTARTDVCCGELVRFESECSGFVGVVAGGTTEVVIGGAGLILTH
jgi:hypothetical protein